jgi:RNA polymerase sigma-70 factor (ECF subfamily)
MSETARLERNRSSSSTSLSLIERARDLDPHAWERLVKLYAPLILHWSRRWQLQPADQADILQEVFQAVLAHLRTFRKTEAGDTFRGWLRAITGNKVRDHFRRLAAEPPGAGGTEAYLRLARFPAPAGPPPLPASEASAVDETAEDPGDREAERALFTRALDFIRGEFAERTWRAFWGTVVEARPAADVASELAMTPGAVRVAKCRVLRRLRAELGDGE